MPNLSPGRTGRHGWRRAVPTLLTLFTSIAALLTGPLTGPSPALAATTAAISAATTSTTVSTTSTSTTASTFTNPLVADGADPWMQYYEGNYYLAYTTWSSQLVMRKAPTLEGLKTAKAVTVWSDTTAERCCNFWAPEFRMMTGADGRPHWYLTFSAGTAGNYANQHTQVLESAGTDPMGPYTFRGRVRDTAHDTWAIDGAYLQLRGSLYYLWSAFDGANQNLYIGKMSNPWTLTGQRALLSTPTYAWEKVGNPVNEGPVALQHNGRTFVMYSASFCGTDDYALGQLAYRGLGDPLSQQSWTKSTTPVFSRNDAGGAFGPGHNGFFTSPDGKETWIVYHANPAAGQGCWRSRATRVQKVAWSVDGRPVLGAPAATGTALTVPSGEDGPSTPTPRGITYQVVNPYTGRCLENTLSVLNEGSNVAQHPCSPTAANQQWFVDSTGDGAFRLINANSRKSLTSASCGTVDGTNVVQLSWQKGACQRWSLTPAADGSVRIDDVNSGKTLDVEMCFKADDVNVRLWTFLSFSPCQTWRLQPVGQVAITNVNNGKVLAADCATATAGDGAAVTMRTPGSGICGTWTFTAGTGNSFSIREAQSGRCLGTGGSSADGATTDLRTCATTAADQFWSLAPQSDGTLRLINTGSGKSLDVSYCGLADGTRAGQYPWFNNDCQRFRLVVPGQQTTKAATGIVYPQPRTVSGDVTKVHDPSMVRTPKGTYLLASTSDGIAIRSSKDGRTYTLLGKAFPNGTPWAAPYLPAGGGNLWAPDISYHNGKYYMYYAASNWGSRHSGIFLATSPTGLPGTWTNLGLVIDTQETDSYNAIDPNLLVDAQGKWWLTFGSFWTGIKMISLNPATGLRSTANTTLYSLAARPDLFQDNAIEAPYIVRHGSYYYLFVSYDWCCRGTSSTYRTMVGRSTSPTGPYLTQDGRNMLTGAATQVLATHDAVPGTGHVAVVNDGRQDLLIYHYYWDNTTPDMGKLGINPISWATGWPVVTAG